MKHSLTLEKCAELTSTRLLTEDLCIDMRAAADWQLIQVMTWLDKNLSNYAFKPFYELIPDLKEAMRPQQQEES